MVERARRVIRLGRMSGSRLRASYAVVAALTLAGCSIGSEGTIPESNADDLLSALDAMQRSVGDGNCEIVDDYAADFTAGVDALPNSVDEEVRDGLNEAATQLTELASDDSQCDPPQGTSDEGGVVTDDTPPPTTTEATTTTTTTSEPVEETTTEEPPPEEETTEEPVAPPTGDGDGADDDGGAVSGGSTGGIGGGGGG